MSEYPKVIGLTGYAQSGKDTVGTYLKNVYQYQRVAFADSVRDSVALLDPWIADGIHTFRLSHLLETVGWDEAKVKHYEVRRLLQVMGTEVGRMLFGPNVWIDIAARKAAEHERVVITDVRFANEAEWIRSQDGVVVKVERPGVGAVNGHASENLDFDVDHTVMNAGSLHDLYDEVDSLLSYLV